MGRLGALRPHSQPSVAMWGSFARLPGLERDSLLEPQATPVLASSLLLMAIDDSYGTTASWGGPANTSYRPLRDYCRLLEADSFLEKHRLFKEGRLLEKGWLP